MPAPTIPDSALDYLEGVDRLFDVAFGHDLAVAFEELGTHDAARELAEALRDGLAVIADELLRVEGLGLSYALVSAVHPLVEGLCDLLSEAARGFGERAITAMQQARASVARTRAHLVAIAAMGATGPIAIEDRTAQVLAIDAMQIDLDAFLELLDALEPLPLAPLPYERAPMAACK